MSESIVGIQPDELQRLAAGKAMSSLLQIALDLDLFAKLRGRRLPPDELAEAWGMPKTSGRFIAQSLVNLGLLTYEDGEVGNGTLAEAYLATDSPMRRALSMPLRYAVTSEQLQSHLMDPPPSQWYQMRDDGEIHDTRALLWQEPEGWIGRLAEQRHEMRVGRGKALAQVYDFSDHHTLLDLGGSSGGYCYGIRSVHPHLKCVVMDLPEAAEVARKHAAAAGLEDHIGVVAGSIFTDDVPPGIDVAMTANMLHLWGPEDIVTILRKLHDGLEDGGTMLVRETFFEDDWTGPIEAVFDGFVLLGKEGKSGWQPTYSEMEELMKEAGFHDVERRPNLVVGRK